MSPPRLVLIGLVAGVAACARIRSMTETNGRDGGVVVEADDVGRVSVRLAQLGGRTRSAAQLVGSLREEDGRARWTPLVYDPEQGALTADLGPRRAERLAIVLYGPGAPAGGWRFRAAILPSEAPSMRGEHEHGEGHGEGE